MENREPIILNGKPTALKLLRAFFRAAAIGLVLVTFSFSVDEAGTTWIMWRDATLLAATLLGVAALMGLGWIFASRRIRAEEVAAAGPAVPEPEPIFARPYNIFGPMATRTRGGLAVAVFFIFGTLGPLNALLTPPDQVLRPLEIIISTIASGAISTCLVLFGHRKILLVLSMIACIALLTFIDPVATFLAGSSPLHLPMQGNVLTLSRGELADYRDQRAVVAAGGMVFLTLGYIMFIVLLSREGGQRTRLQAEMSLARKIQQSLIPSAALKAPGAGVAGITVPTSEVGGDYFDFLALPDGRIAVLAADVSGHGVGAGILGAMAKSAFRAHIERDPSPGVLMSALNRTLVPLVEKKMFITAAYLLLDPRRGRARIATAGHPAVLQKKNDGMVVEIRTPSLALGINAGGQYAEADVACGAGEMFLLYTDGVLEGTNTNGEQFGTERLKEFIGTIADGEPSKVSEGLLRTLREFRAKEEAEDDVTIVAVMVHGER